MFGMSRSWLTKLQLADGHVGHVAARDHDVTHGGRLAQVLEHLVPALGLGDGELELLHLGHVVAHQVHAGAVTAVLRAGREQLGEHLGGVAVGQPFHLPHLCLVQRVTRGHRVVGPRRVPVVEGGQHVVPQRVVPEIRRVHRVDHVRRDQDGHRRPLFLIAVDRVGERLRQQRTERGLELLQVLDGVAALPERALPVLLGHALVPRDARPIRLHEGTRERVGERLLGGLSGCRGS